MPDRRSREHMSETRESDQHEQRRANFDELVKLGVDPYPHAFERTHTVHDLVSQFSARSGAELEAGRGEAFLGGGDHGFSERDRAADMRRKRNTL